MFVDNEKYLMHHLHMFLVISLRLQDMLINHIIDFMICDGDTG